MRPEEFKFSKKKNLMHPTVQYSSVSFMNTRVKKVYAVLTYLKGLCHKKSGWVYGYWEGARLSLMSDAQQQEKMLKFIS